jgi:hypothetical protein
MLGYQQTILSQYGNSPTLRQLIANVNAYLDPSANINSFYSNIWNIATAQGYGLDVWGRIVGVSRVLQISSGAWLGFKESNDSTVETPFGQAPFYAGTGTTANFALTDTSYRQLIYAKAALNITSGSIPAINQILMTLFGSQGPCWCTDGQNMTMTYTFDFTLNPVNYAIVSQSGVLPRPCGVSTSIVQLPSNLYNDGGILALLSIPDGYPTSPTGLTAGALWSNGGLVSVAGTTTPSPSASPVFFGAISDLTLLALGGANLPLSNPGAGTQQLWNSSGIVYIA